MKKIKHFLNQHNIQFKIVQYSEQVKNAEEASKFIGLPLVQIVKSLLVKINGNFLLFLLSSDKKLDTTLIEKDLDAKMKLASPDEVFKITGYRIGTVTPLFLKNNIKIYIDVSLLEFEQIGIGSGMKGIEIILNPNDLKNILNASEMKLSK